jgi:hypothetical protein
MNAGATAAAAAAIRRRREEEEELIQYTPDDLSDHWEFKILRSMTGAFKKPHFLERVLEEEARSGWMLVEKFDNGRIRLKRPASAKAMPSAGGVDPYRTYVGLTEGQFALVVVGCTVGSMILLSLLIAAVAAMS